MATSLVLIFLTHAGASLGSTSFLGIELKFKNPSAILHFVWVFLFYYLFRYYQYFRQEPGGGITRVYYEDLYRRTTKKVYALKLAQYPEGEFPDERGHDFRYLKKKGFWKREFDAVMDQGEQKIRVQVPVELDLRNFIIDGIRSAVWVLVNTSKFTDYQLPFILAIFAMGFALL